LGNNDLEYLHNISGVRWAHILRELNGVIFNLNCESMLINVSKEKQKPLMSIVFFKTREFKWQISVLLLIAYSAFTNFWGLAGVERSEYYAAISKSMSLNFSNFIFGAMDPAGTITVDKIPGSFWIPALFVRIFGFSTLAVTLPNALAGIAATLVMAFVTKKYFGMTAGLIVGWILATTPIVVAVSRSNQPYPMYYLSIAFAIRFSIIALKDLSRKDLIWAGVWIGIAFNSYMLLAWILWPPLILGYLFTPQDLKSKCKDLLISGFSSLLTSFLWIALVTLVPKSERPFISGTNSNSGFDLVFGYNGLGRFFHQEPKLNGTIERSFSPPFGGNSSVLRFFNDYLIGQISWLLPTAILSLILLIFLKHKSPIFIFATLYLIIQIFIFSSVEGMHQFYIATVAFPIALLIIIGLEQFRMQDKQYFIVSFLILTSIWALFVTFRLNAYLFPTPIFQFLILLVFLALSTRSNKGLAEIATSVLFICTLVLTPALWSINAVSHSDPWNPMAGPTFSQLKIASFQKEHKQLGGIIKLPDKVAISGNDYRRIIEYIRSKTDSKYALTTFTSLDASSFITATDDLIYPVGGFNGHDPSPTAYEFIKLVNNGSIRFVLGSIKADVGAVSSNFSQIHHWVIQNCAKDSFSDSKFQLLDCK